MILKYYCSRTVA